MILRDVEIVWVSNDWVRYKSQDGTFSTITDVMATPKVGETWRILLTGVSGVIKAARFLKGK